MACMFQSQIDELIPDPEVFEDMDATNPSLRYRVVKISKVEIGLKSQVSEEAIPVGTTETERLLPSRRTSRIPPKKRLPRTR